MKEKKCNRIKFFLIELLKDWDELNLAFKSLLFIGGLIFLIIVLFTVFGDEGNSSQDSIESMFRTTVSSVFGFLLSSNIKNDNKKNAISIKNLRYESQKEQNSPKDDDFCEYSDIYKTIEVNIIQILVALLTTIISIIVLSILLVTNNLDNVASISQIRVLMCSSIGFLIGEADKK